MGDNQAASANKIDEAILRDARGQASAHILGDRTEYAAFHEMAGAMADSQQKEAIYDISSGGLLW